MNEKSKKNLKLEQFGNGNNTDKNTAICTICCPQEESLNCCLLQERLLQEV